MMRRLLLLHCFSLTAVALVHSFTAGPSSSSPSSRMAVVAGRSIASRQWQPQRPTTYLCTASKDDDTQPQQRPNPKTFREGEVLGLRLMQGGKHDEALEGEFSTCVICLVDTSAFLYTKQYTSLTPRKYTYIYIHHHHYSSIPTGHEITGFANGHCTHAKCIRTIAGRRIQGRDGVAYDIHVGCVRITGRAL